SANQRTVALVGLQMGNLKYRTTADDLLTYTGLITLTSSTPGISSTSAIVTLNVNLPMAQFVSPNSIATNDTQEVILRGHAFTGATGVNFGSTPATSFTVVNDSELHAITPL